ncbi:hypothetical protein L596_000529 [Steinernema carpocapsae]|uniref:Uncharacterized protein n=1 Tax=Steinernema carpocapsae TaxID=34508 RepID=A0A4U8UIP3_STECR|nr:hypothetical protein L596_000529 [Steinernema carpocapsae]
MTTPVQTPQSNQPLIHLLCNRQEHENVTYPEMEHLVVVAKSGTLGTEISCLWFSVMHGVTAAFHSHRIQRQDWPTRIPDIKNFIGDVKSTGVFIDAEDRKLVREVIAMMLRGEVTEAEVKDSIYDITELETALLKILAPHNHKFPRTNCQDYETDINSSFENVMDAWRRIKPDHCCINGLVMSSAKRIWHLLKMVQAASNVFRDSQFTPSVNTFAAYFPGISVQSLAKDSPENEADEKPKEHHKATVHQNQPQKQEDPQNNVEDTVEPEDAPQPQTITSYRDLLDSNGEMTWDNFFRLYPKKT